MEITFSATQATCYCIETLSTSSVLELRSNISENKSNLYCRAETLIPSIFK